MDYEEDLIRGIRCAVWAWYDFSHMENALFINGEEQAVDEILGELSTKVVCKKMAETIDRIWIREHQGEYDGILSIADIEKVINPVEVLSGWKQLLKPNGKLLLGMNNRFGLRYFCGDRDPYTERNFDGIENYHTFECNSDDKFLGRVYSKVEIENMLCEAGIKQYRFYSVLPDLENCTLLYGEEELPNEDLTNRLFPTYNCPDTVFLDERQIYDGIIKNGMFHHMANAFFIECSLDGVFSDVFHVTSSMERGREHAFFTLIHKDGCVEKRGAYPEGTKHLQQMADNMATIRAHGIPVVEGRMVDNSFFMPYMTGVNGLLYLERLMKEDWDTFLQKLDEFCGLILRSSEIEKENIGDGEGAILRKGFMDMVPWNSFYQDGKFIFFDQEFCESKCPANAVLIRTVSTMQGIANKLLGNKIPSDFLLKRYGLYDMRKKWWDIESKFLKKLRMEDDLRLYHKNYRHNIQTINENRFRMNYSADKFQKLFVDIFHNADSRKVLVFGSGKFADRFIALYKDDYPIHKVIDNNSARWGDTINGIEIVSPDILKELRPGEYKVIICIKNYNTVMKQLDELGVTEYSIYDANREYQRKFKPIASSAMPDGETKPKKYHVGYIAGVFDLFHIGHLNMFKRAKALCDYLIVGVVSDAGVREFKKVEPFIPFDERIEMVRSCRYVDQAEEIPLYYNDTWDAWKLYHFDVQFSGSDYEHDEYWLKKQAFLRERGADMVFFPYTEQTSSTKIKALIKEKLL